MSDDGVTQKKPDPQGLTCPAAQPLCLCGIRGCKKTKAHTERLMKSSRRYGIVRKG
jgi:hypothetical protein